MENEIKTDLPDQGVDETSNVSETPENSAPDPDAEVDILQILGEPTEKKPEPWEQQQKVNENVEGFDPPPRPEADISTIDPDRILQKQPDGSLRTLASAKSKFMAGMIIEGVDVFAPWTIAKFIAKDDNSALYCADDEMKQNAKEATARYLGEKNVEVSPFYEMLFAISMMYAEPVMNAMHTAKLQKENDLLKSKNNALEQREKERKQREKDAEDLRQKEENAKLRLNVARLEEQIAKKNVKAQQLSTKAAPTRKKPKASPKKQNGKN